MQDVVQYVNRILFIIVHMKDRLYCKIYTICLIMLIQEDICCPICLNYCINNDLICKTHCQHVFCKSCIKQYIIKCNNNCPVCRLSLDFKCKHCLICKCIDNTNIVNHVCNNQYDIISAISCILLIIILIYLHKYICKGLFEVY